LKQEGNSRETPYLSTKKQATVRLSETGRRQRWSISASAGRDAGHGGLPEGPPRARVNAAPIPPAASVGGEQAEKRQASPGGHTGDSVTAGQSVEPSNRRCSLLPCAR